MAMGISSRMNELFCLPLLVPQWMLALRVKLRAANKIRVSVGPRAPSPNKPSTSKLRAANKIRVSADPQVAFHDKPSASYSRQLTK